MIVQRLHDLLLLSALSKALQGRFANPHGDSTSQQFEVLSVPICSPEAAVSPATLV